jgi:hypothetical protein
VSEKAEHTETKVTTITTLMMRIIHHVLAVFFLTVIIHHQFVHSSKYQPEGPPYHKYDVIVKDRKIYVEGKEFFVKAMAYQPAPLGIKTMKESGYGGGGFCSAKKTIFGEFKSACFGSDFYDGVTAENNRIPPGPSLASGVPKPWWLDVWKRDFEKMKDLGVNTLRVYNMNPITKYFLNLYPEEFSDAPDPERAAMHLPFLNLAQQYGFKVIVPILQDESFLLGKDSKTLDKYIESQVRELGGHPALLMWVTGNEMQVDAREELLQLVNDKMNVIRKRMMAVHGRRLPVTHAVVDLPTSYEYLAQNLQVDVFTANAGYRDVQLNPLWIGDEKFPGWSNLSKTYDVPLFVGEIGMHQDAEEITNARPYWFNQQWKQIVDHIDDGCVGAAFFEYSDEIQKDGKQSTMGAVRLVEKLAGDKSSLDANYFTPDDVQEKKWIYQAIKQGIPGTYQPFHMNADVFQLVNRQQTELEDWNPVARSSNSAAAAGSNVTSIAYGLVLLIVLAIFQRI